MIRGAVRRIPFAVAVLLSLVVLFAPGSDVPSGVPISDKIVHGSLFALLALTGVLAGLAAAPLGAGLAAYAVVSEILQAVLPIDRDGDLFDALADVAGVLVGLAIGLALLAALSGRVGRGAARTPRSGPGRRAGSAP